MLKDRGEKWFDSYRAIVQLLLLKCFFLMPSKKRHFNMLPPLHCTLNLMVSFYFILWRWYFLQKTFHFFPTIPQRRLHSLSTTLSTNNGSSFHLYHWPCLLEGNSWVLSEEDWFDLSHYLLIDKTSAGALLIPPGEVLKMEDMFLPNDIDATHTRSNSTNVCVESTQSLYLVSFSISKHSLWTPITKDCTSQPQS